METINRAGLMRVIRAPKILHVNHATFIPSGMHGAVGGVPEKLEHRDATEQVFKKLVGRGIHPNIARGLVTRAKMRHHGRTEHQQKHRGFTYMRRAGLSDGEPTIDDVVSKAQEFQLQHRGLLAQLGAQPNDALTKENVRNSVEALYNAWTQYAVGVKDGTAPYQWDRSNPMDAVLIAVRDDLRNTADLIAANKAQQALAKQIANLPKLGTGKPGFNIDVPWYVWAAGAVAAVGVGSKALHLW